MNTQICSITQQIQIHPGTLADFHRLKRFHYRAGPPGAVKRVWVATYAANTPAAVLVESLPALGCSLRNHATAGRYLLPDRPLAAALLNREVRCLSRVIVHPVFRALGLAVALVRHALSHAETPFVEALAAMGRVHPFFELAGMRPYDRPANPATVRMLAALETLGLNAAALCHENLWGQGLGQTTPEQRAFLERELRRYLREDGHMEVLTLISHARARLLSQPIYYLWKR